MPAVVGISLAIIVAIYARLTGFDRDRAFYPVVLVVVASYYDLFAVMGGTGADLIAETIGFVIFAAVASVGFRTSLWIVVAGLAGHGLFDFVHRALIPNPGVPSWWPAWCAAYDVTAAACLGLLLWRGDIVRR